LGDDAALLPVRMMEDDVIEVDGAAIGWLRGFRFEVDAGARLADRKLLLAAADRHLSGLLAKRAGELLADGAGHFAMARQGARIILKWRGEVVARLQRGGSLLTPRIDLSADIGGLPDTLRNELLQALEQRVRTLIGRDLLPLLKAEKQAARSDCPGSMRAMLNQLSDAAGVLPRRAVEVYLRDLDGGARKELYKLGVRLGSLDVYFAEMIKPRAQELFAMLRDVFDQPALANSNIMPDMLPPVIGCAHLTGTMSRVYRRFGVQAVRIDMVEKLALKAHKSRAKSGAFAVSRDLAVSMGLKPDCFEQLLYAAGFRKSGMHPVPQDKAGTGVSGDASPSVQHWRWQGLSKAHDPRDSKAAAVPIRPDSPFAALAELKTARD